MRGLFRTMSVAALALLAASAVGRAEPVKIRGAFIVTPASLMPILFAHPGIAKHNGVSYEFEAVHFTSTPTIITGMAAGEIEIATFNFATLPIAIENAGLTDLRIIADETQDGVDDYFTVQYMVLKDSPIKTVKDLKGKAVAINGIGAGVEIGLRYYLQQNGLMFQKDYTTLEVPFPTMKAVLLDHKADLVTGVLPFLLDPQLLNAARTLFTLKDALNGTELSMWEVRQSFIDKHRAALVDLMEDMVRSYRWYADPANHKEAVQIVSNYTKIPVERLEWAFTKKDTYRDLDGLPNLKELQANVHAVQQLGIVKTDLDVAKYADLSLVKEGAARIK